jgi:signal transduction histidine kinase
MTATSPDGRLDVPAGASLAGAPDPFEGPGEMRARGRALDWGATSLGPVAGWSPTLRTAVRMCLESPFPVNLWCGPERVLIYNDGYRRVLGGKHPRALGRPGLEVWAEIAPQLVPMFARIDAGGEPVYAENAPFVMARADGAPEGELAYFTFGLSAIRDDAGAIVAYFNPATETTARVRAEEALAAANRRLDDALLAGEVGTYQWDVPDDRLWGDANFARIFDIVLDPTGAAPLADYLAAIHPDDRDRTAQLVQHTLETGAPYATEYRIVPRRAEGAIRWVEARGRVEYDADHRPLRFSGVVQDITRRREAEAERARLLEEAEAARREAEVANRAKSDFLATMSHELRTPLNAIGGYADLIGMGVPVSPPEELRPFVDRIRTAQRHLLHLINAVLNFAKLEAGRVEFHLDSVPVGDLLDGVQLFVEPQVLARQQQFHCDPCDDGFRVRADREKVSQILLNLVSNAVKFTPPGGEIRIWAEAAGDDTIAIHVRDTGQGIPADKLDAVFDPFVQVDSQFTREAQGTGLGLAISRELARGMHGELTAESTLGVGSTFTLTLPRSSGSHPERSEGSGHGAPAPDPSLRSG